LKQAKKNFGKVHNSGVWNSLVGPPQKYVMHTYPHRVHV